MILAGSGVRIAGVVDLFRKRCERLGVPVTTAWTHDLIASDHPLFCGRPGTIGDRAGNFTVQNSERCWFWAPTQYPAGKLQLAIFARAAYKIQVDIDPAEMKKPTVRPDLPIHCDLRVFLEEMNRQLRWIGRRSTKWVAWCSERVNDIRYVPERHRRRIR